MLKTKYTTNRCYFLAHIQVTLLFGEEGVAHDNKPTNVLLLFAADLAHNQYQCAQGHTLECP